MRGCVCTRAFESNDLFVPIAGVVGVKEAAAESTCPPPINTHTHTCTHILCPSPHITPHLVMKTSSIIPPDRPQGPKNRQLSLGASFCGLTLTEKHTVMLTCFVTFS
ncbi:hypothetical protein AMECASPLE_002898 [Ameca splendens]|uniref:Uncharacterized protein n=1 Tax=Ameca splendens TaxID=208324 RepID=A0ABV0XBG7_9TELE